MNPGRPARSGPVARLYRLCLRAWPAPFRARHGAEMEADFRAAVGEARSRGRVAWLRAVLVLYGDAVAGGLAERAATRTPRRSAMLSALRLDLRYTLRSLRRSPAFTTVVVLTLAVGIGANAAVFQPLHRAFLRPLPYPHAEQLVRLQSRAPGGITGGKFAAADALALAGAPGVGGVALLDWGESAVADEGGAEVVRDASVSRGFFPMLGAVTRAGRLFTATDDAADADAVVVLSHAFWQSHFGGDPAAVGRTLRVNGRPHTVVGVLAPGFTEPGAAEAGAVALWRLLPTWNAAEHRDEVWLNAFARLEDDGAAASLEARARSVAAENPALPEGWTVRAVPLRDAMWGEARTPMLLSLLATGFVLLVVVANLANLLFVRALQRSHESAVRMALGAGRGALVRQRLVEAAILCGAGLGGAVLLAWWASAAVHGAAGGLMPELTAGGVEPAAVAFACAVALVAALLATLLPELARGRAAFHRLRDGSRSGPGRRGRRLRSAFAATQVALSAVLLVSAGLALRSLGALSAVDTGFAREGVLTFEVALPAARYADDGAVQAYQQALLERLAALPGVTDAGAVDMLPLGSRWGCRAALVEGRPVPADWREAECVEARVATPGYFAALGIETIAGRGLAETDRDGSEAVAVVSRALAARLFPGETAVGRRLAWFTGEAPAWLTVVGVVEDVRHRGPAEPPMEELYLPASQSPTGRMSFVVRAAEAGALAPAVREAVRSTDAEVPVRGLRTMEAAVAEALRVPRLVGYLLGGLAGLALLLACMGIYGVLAQGVAERRREIGLRLALGAGRGEVRRMVLGQGLLLAGGAAALGLALGAGVARLMAGLLFGVSAADPLTYAQVGAGLLAAAGLASWLPAARATRVAPAEALRE